MCHHLIFVEWMIHRIHGWLWLIRWNGSVKFVCSYRLCGYNSKIVLAMQFVLHGNIILYLYKWRLDKCLHFIKLKSRKFSTSLWMCQIGFLQLPPKWDNCKMKLKNIVQGKKCMFVLQREFPSLQDPLFQFQHLSIALYSAF